jgi:hypothetical protein
MDVDGDSSTLELVRWSESCNGSRPPFLVIHRLSDLSAAPMLVLTLNPEAGQARYTNTWDEKGEWTGRTRHGPDREGRWRPEGGDILIEELLDEAYEVVARFVLNEDRTAWRGPAGGDHEFWKAGADPWVDAIFVRFSELPQGRFFRGGNHGEPGRK